jgi:hypothetical protein
VMILLVLAQMLRKLVYARCQERDLHLRRAGVALVLGELPDDIGLCFLRQRHDGGQASTGSTAFREPARDLTHLFDVTAHLLGQLVG